MTAVRVWRWLNHEHVSAVVGEQHAQRLRGGEPSELHHAQAAEACRRSARLLHGQHTWALLPRVGTPDVLSVPPTLALIALAECRNR